MGRMRKCLLPSQYVLFPAPGLPSTSCAKGMLDFCFKTFLPALNALYALSKMLWFDERKGVGR